MSLHRITKSDLRNRLYFEVKKSNFFYLFLKNLKIEGLTTENLLKLSTEFGSITGK